MILATVGTARQPFDRMVEAVEGALAVSRFHGGEIVFQHGSSRQPNVGMAYAFLPREHHERLVGEASIVISHAGVGTIVMCVRQGKRPVVMPRRTDYGEQANDHQVELAEKLESLGLVFIAHDATELKAHLERPQSEFVIEPPPRNTAAIDRVKRFLDEVECQRGR